MASLDDSGNRLQGLEQCFAPCLKKVHFISLMVMMIAAF
jgi:hypothetical protein